MPALVPVIVSVYVPALAPLAVLILRVDVPEPVTDGGVNLAVLPLGRPVTVRVTVELNPFKAVTVTVVDVEPARFTVRFVELTAKLKSPGGAGGAVTTSVTDLECVRLPLVPVTVTL